MTEQNITVQTEEGIGQNWRRLKSTLIVDFENLLTYQFFKVLLCCL